MWITMNERFKKEESDYNLKAYCEDCTYFFKDEARCAMLYPILPHQKEAFQNAKDGERIYFCKMFEVDNA